MSSCCNEACASDVGEFARVRYFFGQRLTAVDLADEQAYHLGKLRLHHRHLHGWGVVCGLTAERAEPAAGGSASRTLRVRAGAAIDCRGREIVVGVDHCIDVAAWLARNRKRLDETWATAGERRLWVAVRYADCPSDPVMAPRDPCGCNDQGCEYARVREGFDLQLLADLDDACLAAPAGSGALAIAGERALACPSCGSGCAGWLVLARLHVTLADPDDAGPASITIADIGAPEHRIRERVTLLPTSALQELLVPSGGPRLGAPTAGGTLAAPVLRLGVQLVADGPGDSAVPLAAGTVPTGLVRLHTLSAGAWHQLAATTAWDAAAGQLVVTVGAALVAGGLYRLVVAADPATPVVDEQLRPLAPSLALRLRADERAGALVLAIV